MDDNTNKNCESKGKDENDAPNSDDSTASYDNEIDNLPPTNNIIHIDDPHSLIPRFIEPQLIMHNTALAELQAGQKQSCWSWFILPTPPYIVNGEERGSSMNRKYALRDDTQARAYLLLETIRGVNLRWNYIVVLREIAKQIETKGATLDTLLGPVDASKAISSFRLFERIGRMLEDEEVCNLCERVLELVKHPQQRSKRKFFRQLFRG